MSNKENRQILMHAGLKKSDLWADRFRRHGLFYATKVIEKAEPPRLVINSFWRSGSTLLLEFLAAAFNMRPYFEPLTPREPQFKSVYAPFNTAAFNLERMHPITADVEVDVTKILAKKFHSKWVYQCLTPDNFRGQNGRIVKLVTGAHIVPELLKMEIPVLHIQRDIEDVAQSFINSKWTLRFFRDLDLSYLLKSSDKTIAAFYARFHKWLDLRPFNLIEQVTIYHTLTELFVQQFGSNAMFTSYKTLTQNHTKVADQIAQILGLEYDSTKINQAIKRPSRMTVFNENRRQLSAAEVNRIRTIKSKIEQAF